MEERFVAEESAVRLDKYLAERFSGRSRSFFEKLIEAGEVLVDGAAARPGAKLKAGSEVLVCFPKASEIEAKPEDIPLDIVYEDGDILVVNKQKGLVTHPAPGNEAGTLVNALLFHAEGLSGINGKLRPGIVHRLDKDTTGLIVAAKNDAAHASLAAQIREKTARRIYTALLFGRVKEDEGKISAPIGRNPKERKKMGVVPDGREAVTLYRVLRRYDKYTLAEFELETGRTHQIRVHAAHIHHPVVGDTVYTRLKAPFKTEGQMLHAGKLTLRHPGTGEEMEFLAPLPPYFEVIIKKLEAEAEQSLSRRGFRP